MFLPVEFPQKSAEELTSSPQGVCCQGIPPKRNVESLLGNRFFTVLWSQDYSLLLSRPKETQVVRVMELDVQTPPSIVEGAHAGGNSNLAPKGRDLK